ncbi:MAG TPA: ERAP1-like C-terminal domain-containing protein, partial [Gemmatimonadales bacterium]|nr:ERAP1-like C-terminal domain-containing protein [Gemmatimonadales bacterium]
RVPDPFLRAMLWGALWDEVRQLRMAPARFVRLALRDLPAEADEQIVPFVLGRLGRAVGAYLSVGERDSLAPAAETTLWNRAGDAQSPYGIRKAYLDAFIDLAASADGIARLDTLLAADSAAGEPLRDPTRWETVTRLLTLAAPQAERRYAAQQSRDTTPDGRRRAFIAGAARRSAETKREYFARYFDDATLNEEWASGSLDAFNAIEHESLTLPYLRPALDSLGFIQANRRIFFLESWLGAFLTGQTSDSALQTVHNYLDQHPHLPEDLRRKVLQHADELDRTVRIRERRQP